MSVKFVEVLGEIHANKCEAVSGSNGSIGRQGFRAIEVTLVQLAFGLEVDIRLEGFECFGSVALVRARGSTSWFGG